MSRVAYGFVTVFDGPRKGWGGRQEKRDVAALKDGYARERKWMQEFQARDAARAQQWREELHTHDAALQRKENRTAAAVPDAERRARPKLKLLWALRV